MTCRRPRAAATWCDGGGALPLLRLLLLLALYVCVALTISGVHGVTIQLHSADYLFAPHASLEQNVVDGKVKHCVVVSLEADDFASALVRFRYRSNVTTPRLRLPLVLTVHRPNEDDRNVAQLSSASFVAVTQVYNPTELHKRQESKLERARAAGEQAAAAGNDDDDNDDDDDIIFTFRPKDTSSTRGNEADVHGEAATDGTYAVCFSLDPGSAQHARVVRSAIFERVDIDVLEAASSRPWRHAAAVGGADGNEVALRRARARALLDPDGVYTRELRRIYGVSADTDIDDMLLKPDVLSSNEMHKLAYKLRAVHDMMQSIMHTMSWASQRDARMRRTSESTFTRIWVSMLCILVVMMSVVWFTFHYTKRIIIKRKLI